MVGGEAGVRDGPTLFDLVGPVRFSPPLEAMFGVAKMR